MANSTPFLVKFDEKLYDLKKFLRDHPGGVGTLKPYEGKSIKRAMLKFGHSTSAYHILNDFRVDDKLVEDSNLTGAVSENGRILTKAEGERDEKEVALLEDLESRLDWSKPIFAQLEIIAPHYNKWVNVAVNRPFKIFANPFLEAMTHTPWYLVPAFWTPIILCLTYLMYHETVGCKDSCTLPQLSRMQFLSHIIQGVILWTSLEYCLHRWVFHMNPGSSIFMMKLHFLIHGLHHKMPFDSSRYVFPPLGSLGIAYFLYQIVRLLVTYPQLKLIGALVGYMAYEMIHVYVHYGSPADGTYLYALKRYHSNHHFINHDKAFGVSSNIWDHIFRTFVNVKKLNFSLHWNLQ